MAGIFGYIINHKKNSMENPEDILSEYATRGFSHKKNFKSFANKNMGIGFAAPFYDISWPLVSKDGKYCFQLFGELYLPDSTKLVPANFDEGFLKPFLEKKADFLRQIDGGFVFALLDTENKNVILCSDPFGNFQLYYYYDQDIILFSSQIQGIAEILNLRQWDRSGFYEYLGLGFSLSGKTYYEGIRCLNTAEICELNFKQHKSAIYFRFSYDPDTNVKQNIRNIDQHLATSIQKRLDSYKRVGSAITGGFDSRITWAIIKSLDSQAELFSFTHGLDNSRDMKIAQKLARYLKLNHIISVFDYDFIRKLPQLWEPYTRMTEGLGLISSAHALSSWKTGAENYDILLDSHGGALYRRQYMKVAEKRFKADNDLGRQFFGQIKSSIFNLNIFKQEMSEHIIKAAINGLQIYFDSQRQLRTIADQIDAFYINEVSAHKTSASGNVQMNWLMLAHPLLNLQALEAIQKIPVDSRARQTVYKYIISSRLPGLKFFSLENMGMPAPYFGFTTLRYLPMIYERILNNSVRKISYAAYNKLSLQRFVTNYDLFFRINFAEIKNILLRENDSFADIVDKTKLEKLIVLAENNQGYRLGSWSHLLTLKLFLDIFHP